MSGLDMASAQSMLQLSLGFISARAIYVAAKLGIADQIHDGSRTVRELARNTGVDDDALFRVMRLLAGVGVLRQSEAGTFSLTSLGETLRSDSAQSVRDYVILYRETVYQVFANIIYGLSTGESAILKTFGKDYFEMAGSDPEFAAVFHKGLASRAKNDTAALLEVYDFSSAKKVADIGGGAGALLSAILARYAQVSGILFDIKPAIDAAKAGRGGPLPRCELVVGDFFDRVPSDADLYVLKLVLHDWGDDDAARILKTIRTAIGADSRLLILEGLIGAPNDLNLTSFVDLNMLLGTRSGRERTEAEFATLLKSAGFKLKLTIPTNSALHILEAVPA
jgi:hypothetical protein